MVKRGKSRKERIGKPVITTEVVERHIIDSETGEIITDDSRVSVNVEQDFIRSKDSKNFTKMFFENFKKMYQLGFPIDKKILLLADIFHRMSYAIYAEGICRGQEFIVDKSVKEEWTSLYGISESAIKYQLRSLVKEGVIASLGKGKYAVNPFLYGKGNSAEITALRTAFDITPGNQEHDAQVSAVYIKMDENTE